jgi:hypothetical protein
MFTDCPELAELAEKLRQFSPIPDGDPVAVTIVALFTLPSAVPAKESG